jgi:predicted ATP-binding protein involved in virulence
MENFRGFAEIEIDFSRAGNLAVLVGRNGAGKSSVLDCVAMFLSRLASCLTHPGAPPFPLGTKKDIRKQQDRARLVASYRVDGLTALVTDEEHILAEGLSPYSSQLQDHVRDHWGQLPRDKNASVPVLCHYSPGSGDGLMMMAGGANGAVIPEQARAFYFALASDPEGFFQSFLRWFRVEEDIENQTRLRKDMSYRSKLLTPVRDAMERFLSGLPGAGRFANFHVERETVGDESELFKVSERVSYVVEKDGVTFDIEQLSLGERSMLLLVADLALRFAHANPALVDPLLGSGIVLIDEIERHLHPAWQRAILPGLGKIFPNCQFIVTTHSPQVLSRVEREHVFILENFELLPSTPYTYGHDANSILGEVMGVSERPADIEDKIRLASILVEEERLDEARAALGELSFILGADDVEVVGLGTMIRFMNKPVRG